MFHTGSVEAMRINRAMTNIEWQNKMVIGTTFKLTTYNTEACFTLKKMAKKIYQTI